MAAREKETNSSYVVIGLMSGTSLDGLDIACCKFGLQEGVWHYEILEAETVNYSSELINKLKESAQFKGDKLALLDVELGQWYASQVNDFIRRYELSVDYIASHGHTVFHQPERKLTMQIGNGIELHVGTRLPVICDFRSYDVALGGQGAPLVPIGDKLLFSNYDYCINLGGIANLSADEQGVRIAYDIAPCNMVLNRLSERLGAPYDKGGALARQGVVNHNLLKALDNWSYYELPKPKSLGYEQVHRDIFPIIDNELPVIDNLATFTEHLAVQLAKAIAKGQNKILVTGGGAYNTFLIERFKAKLSEHIEVVVPGKQLVEFKEALIFAFLGLLRVRGEINCLSSVTGASRDSSSGIIFQ